jgi:hypothetical protein
MVHLLHSLAAAAIALSITAAAPPVALTIQQPMGAAPFYTRARVSIPRHPDNRYACLSWTQVQGGQEGRTSCWEVAGEDAPLTHWHELKALSSGKWEVVAYVLRNDESNLFSNRITLRVTGPNYEPDPPL